MKPIVCAQPGRALSPAAPVLPYIRTARGRPASRRILPPSGCFLRGTIRRLTVVVMDSEGDQTQGGLSLPADVYVRARKFAIDHEICLLANPSSRGVGLATRWANRNLDAAIAFGRRTLEVCFLAASGPHPDVQKPDWVEDWRAGVEASSAARDAIRNLLLFMAPQDPQMSRPDHLAVPLRHMVKEANPALSFAEAGAEAEAQAKILQAAWAILSGLPDHMERHRSELASSTQNPGNPAKREFVAYLAASWVFLTGRAPGKSPNRAQNPFLRFAEAAWADLSGSPTSFERSLRTLDTERLLAEEWEGRSPPF